MISPEFKRFPSEWKVLPFLEVFEDVTSKGKKVKKENYQITGDIPVVDQGQKFFGGYTDVANKITGVDLPAIVFGDHTKAFKYVEVDFAIGADGVKLLNPKIDADKKFLFYYLKQLKLEDAGYSRHFKFLKETYIPLPPLETQKKIAAVLEKADQLRKDCQQMEQELNSLAQSVFIDMFGDPVTNPKGWDVCALESLIVKGDRINYGVVQPGQFVAAGTGIPLIRISDFAKGKISLEKIKYIGDEVESKYKRSRIVGDEILIACVGATIGKTAVVTEEHKGFNIARAVTRIRVNDTVNRHFLHKYLESDFVQSFFVQETRSVGQPTLNTSLIAKTPILIPDTKTQNLFLEFSKINDRQILYVTHLAREYDQQFNALMQKAFKGGLNL